MLFWIIALALALLIAALFALALLRHDAEAEHPAAYDLRIYRDQLKEVDRDLARGVINEGDAERIRTEVGRRVLAADAQLQKAAITGDQPKRLTRGLAAVISAALLGGGLALYNQIGAPGAPDQPRSARLVAAQEAYASRPSHAEVMADLPAAVRPEPDADYKALIKRLREAVAENPDDLQGQQLLASNEARLGRFAEARTAQEAIIRLKGDEATAADHVTLAQMYITEAQGYVSPEAEAVLRRALRLTGDQPVARYFLGQMWLQNSRPDRTFALWSRLLTDGPDDAPWNLAIRETIEDVAWLAGVDYTPPAPRSASAPALAGPTAEDVENAGEMSAEDRQEMIRGMVSRLSDRLAREGGTPEEWARLIGAYGVLGEGARASAIWGEAQVRFAERPEALEIVRQGARQAGVAP